MKRVIKYLGMVFLVAGLGVTGCQKESGVLTVKMTDAPGIYEEVNVEIERVEVHVDAHRQNKSGWMELSTNAGVYDLIKLQNTTTVLAIGEDLPTGDITQLRLILGTNHSVVINGVSHSLTVPSGTRTGIKVVGHELTRDDHSEIILDFHANQSVILTGDGRYILKPVITVQQ